jgi:hypothetical protein
MKTKAKKEAKVTRKAVAVAEPAEQEAPEPTEVEVAPEEPVEEHSLEAELAAAIASGDRIKTAEIRAKIQEAGNA